MKDNILENVLEPCKKIGLVELLTGKCKFILILIYIESKNNLPIGLDSSTIKCYSCLDEGH